MKTLKNILSIAAVASFSLAATEVSAQQVCIDFDQFNSGVTHSNLNTGDINFTTDSGKPLLVFNSANPDNYDLDFGSPNEDFGGSGIGIAGGSGQAGINNVPLYNVLMISSEASAVPPSPYCTNNDAIEQGSWDNNRIRLTAMGKYYDSNISGADKYGIRWRVRNESQDTRTIDFNFYGQSIFKTVTLQPGQVLHFTSHFVGSASAYGGTLKAFDQFAGIYTTKAHGGSVQDITGCIGSNNSSSFQDGGNLILTFTNEVKIDAIDMFNIANNDSW